MNAGEARKLTTEVREKIPDLDFCLSRIRQAAEKGKDNAVINASINRKAIAKLIDLGYEAREDEYNDLYIKW